MKFIKAIKEASEQTVKLNDVFEEYPEENELIWQFVSNSEFEDEEFEVKTVSLSKVIPKDFMKNFDEYAESWQKKLVERKIKNISKTVQRPIVVSQSKSGPIIVDGNHTLVALIKTNQSTAKVIYI